MVRGASEGLTDRNELTRLIYDDPMSLLKLRPVLSAFSRMVVWTFCPMFIACASPLYRSGEMPSVSGLAEMPAPLFIEPLHLLFASSFSMMLIATELLYSTPRMIFS